LDGRPQKTVEEREMGDKKVGIDKELGKCLMQEMDAIYSILSKNEGLTKGEIVCKYQNMFVRPSKKRVIVGNALLELIQKGRVFFEREKPSQKTLSFDELPYRFFTNQKRSEHELNGEPQQ
jgi:hypothetical protein